MASALHIAVDPYLLCLPNPCHSADQVEGFVRSLLAWSETLDRTETKVLISDGCRLALCEDGQYPHQHRLRDLLHRFEVDSIDHETVCRLTQFLIEKTPSLEDEMGVRCVVFDEAPVQVDPEQYITRLASKTRYAFAEMLFVLSSRYQWGPACEQRAILASVHADSLDTVEPWELSISGSVAEIEWCDDAFKAACASRGAISETFLAFDSHRMWRHHRGVWSLWANGETEDGARDAIDETVSAMLRSGTDGSNQVHYHLGPMFLESARQWGFGSRSDYAMVLIESCARIVLGQPKNPLNTFRTSENGQQWSRTDGALAFRTHLTKKGPGFRLMLWRLANGEIEFANVGDKNELVIQ